MSGSGHRDGGLRLAIEAACLEAGANLGEMTVLAAQNDPFRVDTDAGHRDGEWLAVEAGRLGLGDRVIHLRGLHYMLVSGESVKPNGKPYTNTDPDWLWLQGTAAKAARWLGYLRFDQIRDARNSEPVIRCQPASVPAPYVSVGVHVKIPDADELEPTVGVEFFKGRQPYKLVLYGEKTSLEDVLATVAEQYKADLYLPAGEISDTLLHTMAKTGAGDGRPMIVFTISDCDPAGWQMPVSIGRKLQAFQALSFPDFDFQVHRVALTPNQVREHGFPSTPLKQTERRADRWTHAMGVQQTEIDALAALNPRLLRKIVREALDPFFDKTLDGRVDAAYQRWVDEAQCRLDKQLDRAEIERIQAEAAGKLEELREEIDAINQALHVDIDDLDLPKPVVPEPEIDEADHGLPLVDSTWEWAEQTASLKASKTY